VLTAHRDAAVAEATRLRNQAHQILLQAEPAYSAALPPLTSPPGVAVPKGYQALGRGTVQAAITEVIKMLGQRLHPAITWV